MKITNIAAAILFLSSSLFPVFCLSQSANINPEPVAITGTQQQVTPQLVLPHYQADFAPIIGNGPHDVRWDHGYLVSFGMAEMKEPVSLYDKNGKLLFQTWLTFPEATKVYAEDARATSKGNVVVAATAVSKDGSAAHMIVEAGAEGVSRVIRTNPFYPLRVCMTDEGTIWAYGKELTQDRRAEPRDHYPMLREYSFEKGELRTALDRATVRPPLGVPVSGARNDVYLQCASDKVVLVLGPTTELVQFSLATNVLSRSPIGPLPDKFYMTGAAVTNSGEIYVSTFRPGQNALTAMLHLRLNPPETTEPISLTTESAGNRFFLLLGSDGEDLVYSRGRRASTLFWSSHEDGKAAK